MSQALLAVVLAAAHFALFRRDRRQFLWLWAVGWCAIAVVRVLTAAEAVTAPEPGLLVPATPVLAVLSDWLGFLAIGSLAVGTLAFDRGRDVSRRLLIIIAGGAFVIGLGTAFGGAGFGLPWRYPVRTGLAALACFLAARFIWRGGPDRIGARSVAVAVAMYGVPLAGYAFITARGDTSRPGSTLSSFVAIGHFDTVLMAAMALAIFLWLLSRERAAAETSMLREQSLRMDIEGRESRFRSILHQVPDAIAVLDQEGRYQNDLRPDRQFLGISNERLVGTSVYDLIHPEDWERTRMAFGSLAERPGATVMLEIRIRHADGRWLILECNGSNCVDVPSLRGILVVARDVTESRALHRRLALTERLETVGRLAGGVAHDFNNLLTVVRGNAAMLADRLPLRAAERGWAEEIGQAALRGAHLTRHLLAFARRQPVEPRVFDLNGLIVDLIPILRRLVGESVELVWAPTVTSCPVRADPHQIEQVVVNLCANARDAMTAGGLLRIATGRGPDATVALTVTDTGVGMTDETKLRAFEPFFTTKPQGVGAGLGLATSYGIVVQAGGTITLESEPGGGTTVVIRLPGATDAPTPVAEPVAVPATTRGSGVILVVEDEPAVRLVAARALRGAGFEVIEAGDGVEALERLTREPAVRCVATDLVMPRLSGDGLARKIWERTPEFPVLFTSGYSHEFRPDLATRTGRSAFLQKPYEPGELVQAVTSLLSSVRATESAGPGSRS